MITYADVKQTVNKHHVININVALVCIEIKGSNMYTINLDFFSFCTEILLLNTFV